MTRPINQVDVARAAEARTRAIAARREANRLAWRRKLSANMHAAKRAKRLAQQANAQLTHKPDE